MVDRPEFDRPPAPAPVLIRFEDGSLAGQGVQELVRTVKDLAHVFGDESARAALPQIRSWIGRKRVLPFPQSA